MSENKEKPAPKETVTEWENGKLVEKELDDGVAFDVLARARPKPVVRQASPFQKAPRVEKNAARILGRGDHLTI